jgi:hypothetical protein
VRHGDAAPSRNAFAGIDVRKGNGYARTGKEIDRGEGFDFLKTLKEQDQCGERGIGHSGFGG